MTKLNKIRSIIIVGFIILLICSSGKTEELKIDSSDLAPKGLGGIVWGQNINSIIGIKRLLTVPNDPTNRVKICEMENDPLKYGNVKLKSIGYCFLDDKFAYVALFSNRKIYSDKFFEEIVKEYGAPTRDGETEKYVMKNWIFGDVEIRYFYNKERGGECSVYFQYTPYANEVDKIFKN